MSFSPDVSENCTRATEREKTPTSDTLQEAGDPSSDSELATVFTANVAGTSHVSDDLDCDDTLLQSQRCTQFTDGCNNSDPTSLRTVKNEFCDEEPILIDKPKSLEDHISNIPQQQTELYEHDAKLQNEASAVASVDQRLQPFSPSVSSEKVLGENSTRPSSCSSSRNDENFASNVMNMKQEPHNDFDVDEHITKLVINPMTSVMHRQNMQVGITVEKRNEIEGSPQPTLNDDRDEAAVAEGKAFGSDIPKIVRDVIVYVCYICNKSFYNLDILRMHLQKHHKQIFCDESKIRTEIVKDALICHLCNGIFKFFSLLQIHLKRAHNLVVYKPNKSSAEQAPKQKRYRRLNDPGVDAILCIICHRRFVNLAGYRNHVKIIHKDSTQYEAAMRDLELVRLKRTGRRSTLVLHCPLCLEECYGTRLFKHISLAHADDPSLEEVKKEAQTMFQREACRHWNKNDNRNRIVSCPMCDRKMKQRVLGRHMSSECKNDRNRAMPDGRIVASPRGDQPLGTEVFSSNVKRCKNNAIEPPMRSRTKSTNNSDNPNNDEEVMDVDAASGVEQEPLAEDDDNVEPSGESQCFLCRKLFKGSRGLNLHMSKVHRQQSLKAPFAVRMDKPAKRQERDSDGLEQHPAAEEGVPSYICDKCGASGKTCLCAVGQAPESSWTISVFQSNTCNRQLDQPKHTVSRTCVPEVIPIKDTL